MSKTSLFASLLAVLAIGIVVTGCAQKQSGGQPSSSPEASSAESAAATHEGHDHGESAHAEHAGHSKYESALAELSSTDRALAEKQKTCPVSGEALGAMGKPHKVTVEGQDVMLCCAGCEAKLKENPQEYLAKINQ